jgi:hypothetical protein
MMRQARSGDRGVHDQEGRGNSITAQSGVAFAEALRYRLKETWFMNFDGPHRPDRDDAQGASRFRDRHSADAIGAGDHSDRTETALMTFGTGAVLIDTRGGSSYTSLATGCLA